MLHLPPRSLSFSVAVLCAAALHAQTSWSLRSPSTSPATRQHAGMTFDEARGVTLLLFGDNSPARNDSWQWNGAQWQPVQAGLPPYRIYFGLVYDSQRQRVVLFGGENGGFFDELWEWDGIAWTQRVMLVRPSARSHHAMAFDRTRQRTVVWSGAGASNMDVWEWNGTSWQSVAANPHPSSRVDVAMAFDPVNQDLLLYGGSDPNGAQLTDTWSWNGTTWTQLQPVTPPYARYQPAMVADLNRARIVLHGGSPADTTTWEWDGSQWHELFLASMGPRFFESMAYDAARGAVVAFGGQVPFFSFPANDTWTYSTPTPASYTAYGSGCPGSSGIPALANKPYTLPWLGDSFTARASNLAPSVAAVIFATGLASTPPQSLAAFGMPGCNALLQPAVAELRLAAAGVADWTFAIPSTPSLAGVHLFQQAFALEPGANAGGIVVSNGADLLTGIR
jgi:hypothetical protein